MKYLLVLLVLLVLLTNNLFCFEGKQVSSGRYKTMDKKVEKTQQYKENWKSNGKNKVIKTTKKNLKDLKKEMPYHPKIVKTRKNVKNKSSNILANKKSFKKGAYNSNVLSTRKNVKNRTSAILTNKKTLTDLKRENLQKKTPKTKNKQKRVTKKNLRSKARKRSYRKR